MRNRAPLLVAVVALVVAACGVGERASPSTFPDSPQTSTTPPTSTIPSTSVTPPSTIPTTSVAGEAGSKTPGLLLSGASLEEGWTERLQPDQRSGPGGGGMMSFAVADFGVVAVGGTCGSIVDGSSAECSSAAWVSENGTDWTKVYGDEAGLGEGEMFAVTAGGPGVVGVGSTCAWMAPPEGCAPAIWTSADGYTWDQAVIPESEFSRCEGPSCQLYAVAGTDSTLVAAGWDGSGLGVWTSADGVEWSKTVLDPDEIIPVKGFDPEVHGEGDFEHLFSFQGSVYAFGTSTLFQYEGDEFIEWWYTGAIWRSGDGKSWTRVDPDGLFGDGDTWPYDVTIWGDSIYLGAEECDRDYNCRNGLWSSTDGTNWTALRADELDSLGNQRLLGVGDALLVMGVLNDLPVVVATADGQHWQTHHLNGTNLFDVYAPANDLIEHNGQLIVISGDQVNTWKP